MIKTLVQRIAHDQYRVTDNGALGAFSMVVSPGELDRLKDQHPEVARLQIGEQVEIERKHKPA